MCYMHVIVWQIVDDSTWAWTTESVCVRGELHVKQFDAADFSLPLSAWSMCVCVLVEYSSSCVGGVQNYHL